MDVGINQNKKKLSWRNFFVLINICLVDNTKKFIFEAAHGAAENSAGGSLEGWTIG
jgi:hypothetical protein